MWLAAYHLIHDAPQWYYRLEHDGRTPNWRCFTELVNLCFGPPLRNNPLGELASCRRTGTVADYQDKFLTLLNRAGSQSEQQQILLFTMGLGDPLCIDVKLQCPLNLEVAMSLARAYELRQ